MENSHGGKILLVKLQAEANVTESRKASHIENTSQFQYYHSFLPSLKLGLGGVGMEGFLFLKFGQRGGS